MKILILFMLVSILSYGQKSPAETVEGTIKGAKITIEYSSPRVNSREIYGSLVPFGNVWRAGANKNTTIEFSKDVEIEGKQLSTGKYGFFIIPNENGQWIAIFSKINDSWGSYKYVESNDALRINIDTQISKESKNELTYTVSDKGIGFAWSDRSFTLNVK